MVWQKILSVTVKGILYAAILVLSGVLVFVVFSVVSAIDIKEACPATVIMKTAAFILN